MKEVESKIIHSHGLTNQITLVQVSGSRDKDISVEYHLFSADSPLLGDMSTRAPVWKVFEKHF